MEFRIADTFTDSLAKLTGQEQKVVKTTAFDLQLDPGSPSVPPAEQRSIWHSTDSASWKEPRCRSTLIATKTSVDSAPSR